VDEVEIDIEQRISAGRLTNDVLVPNFLEQCATTGHKKCASCWLKV
jgi:hypothetical protein